MAKKLYYTRVWQPPSPTITDANDFKYLVNKRKLASLRAAVESGEWQQQFSSDTDSDADAPSQSSTSCTASPKGATTTNPCQELCSKSPTASHQQLSTEERQQAEAELQAELAKRQAAEEQQLQEIYAKLLAEQAEEEERKLAEKAQLVAQHADATRQISEVQQRLEELQQNKHDLVKQLKQAMLAEEAAKQQAAIQMQQQGQWAAQQQQQQQNPLHKGLTPLGIPAGPSQAPGSHVPAAGGLVTPGATGSYCASAGYTPAQTPVGAYVPGSGLFSPGSSTVRSQWLFSTPAPPPPPPPRQPADHSGGRAAPTTAAANGQPGQQALPRAASWGQPPAPPRGFGLAGAEAHAGAEPDVHMQDVSRFGHDHTQQHGVHGSTWQMHMQDHAGTVQGSVARSPRQSVNGSRPWHGTSMAAAGQHLEPPDSPEEGEAIPSPRMPGQQHHKLGGPAATGSRASDAAPHLPPRSLHNRAEGLVEQGSFDRTVPAAPIRCSAAAGRSADRDRPADHGRTSGLLRTSSSGGTGGPKFDIEGHSHQPGLLRSSSSGGFGGGGYAGGLPQPILSPGSAGTAVSGGSYRAHSGLGRSQSASLADRDHPGFRSPSDRGAGHSTDGAEGPMHGSGSSRQPRSGGQYGSAHGQYNAVGVHSQYYAGGAARGRDDTGAASAPVWRGERRRSSSSNVDRFGDDARAVTGAAAGGSFMGDVWQGDDPGAAGDRSQAAWGRAAGAGNVVDRGAVGGHGEGAERKPWSRHPARSGAWR